LSALTTQKLSSLFSFPFRGPNWKQKLMLGSVMTFLSLPLLWIPAVFTAGYIARILRQGLNNQELHLPEWDDWSQLFYDGLRITAASLVFFLPLIVIFMASYAVLMLSPFLAFSMSDAGVQPNFAPTFALITTFASSMGMLLVMPLSLIISMLLPVAITHMIACDSFSAAFDLRRWWPVLRHNLGEFFLITAITFGISLFFSMALQVLVWTIVFCWLLPAVSGAFGFVLGVIANAMYARAYREGARRASSVVPEL
jgi:hypothetical protein